MIHFCISNVTLHISKYAVKFRSRDRFASDNNHWSGIITTGSSLNIDIFCYTKVLKKAISMKFNTCVMQIAVESTHICTHQLVLYAVYCPVDICDCT